MTPHHIPRHDERPLVHLGMGGEVGHVSIDFDGPVCSAGGRGCLKVSFFARSLKRYD